MLKFLFRILTQKNCEKKYIFDEISFEDFSNFFSEFFLQIYFFVLKCSETYAQ